MRHGQPLRRALLRALTKRNQNGTVQSTASTSAFRREPMRDSDARYAAWAALLQCARTDSPWRLGAQGIRGTVDKMPKMDGTDSELAAVLKRLTDPNVPGISAALVGPGGIEELSSAGVADMSGDRPVTPDTVYLWFSMTKIVTATAVMQLAERGLLRLDDPVERFLPEFPKPRSGWPTVEIRHLLSHSAGLANPMPVRWVHPAGETGRDPHAFAVELLAKHDRLRFPAGSKAVYSNVGYIALGEVIAAVSGQSYEDYVRTRILEPLSMTSTGFSYSITSERNVATGYQRRFHPMTPLFRLLLPKGIMGASEHRFVAFNRFLVDGPAYGGLVGSARDAARFMGVHLNGGEFDGVRLLSPEGVEAMQTLQSSGRKLDVGFGWFRRGADRRAGDFWEHLGGGGGFWSMMRIYPARGVGVLSMGNATSYDHNAIADIARDRGASA
jgi:CubicO group peptidase (beta-lactamase class C family)